MELLSIKSLKTESQIRRWLASGATPKGSWNPDTNTPHIEDGVGSLGWYYDVIESGTWNGINFLIGDRVIYTPDNKWERVATGVENESPMVVAYVDETTTAFPTTRTSGSSLKNGDYVSVKSTAILPFIIKNLEGKDIVFDAYGDKAEWNSEDWQEKSYEAGKTNEIGIAKPEEEGITGDEKYQNELNKEYSTKIKLDQVLISVKRLGEYIYEATYDGMPEYEDSNVNTPVSACTTFVRDGKTYRSFDLMYNNTAEFLVHTKDFDGIALIQGIEDGKLEREKLSQLPYHLADGCNRNGIVVSEHLLLNDMNFDGTGAKENDLTKLPTVILQNVKSMAELTSNAEVNEFLANAKLPTSIAELGYALHFLITDNTTTYTLCPKDDGSGYEFVDITLIPKLANFKHIGKAIVERNDVDLQLHPTGIERFNLIDANTELKDLRFTLAYTEPNRLSEFIGEGSTTKESTDEELMPYYTQAHTAYESRTREDDIPTWQSVHAVVYGSKGMEHLWVQENYEKDYIASSEEVKVDNTTIEKNAQKELKIKSIDGITPIFEEAEEFENIDNGDTISTLFGKIKKAISTFISELALKVNTSDIVDNLTSTDNDKPLSAKQGKVLQDNKIEKSDIANNLTTTEEGKVLDARQGKVLDERLTTIEVKPDVVDIVQCYDRGTDTTKTDIVHYDLGGLFVNDIVKVISDETHNELTSYYKVIETEGVKSFNYVGSDKAIELDGTTITKNASGKLSIVESLVTAWNRLVTLFTNITSVVTTITNNDSDLPTSKAIKTELDKKQDVITLTNNLPASLNANALYRIPADFTYQYKTYEKGLYQVIDGKLSKIRDTERAVNSIFAFPEDEPLITYNLPDGEKAVVPDIIQKMKKGDSLFLPGTWFGYDPDDNYCGPPDKEVESFDIFITCKDEDALPIIDMFAFNTINNSIWKRSTNWDWGWNDWERIDNTAKIIPTGSVSRMQIMQKAKETGCVIYKFARITDGPSGTSDDEFSIYATCYDAGGAGYSVAFIQATNLLIGTGTSTKGTTYTTVGKIGNTTEWSDWKESGSGGVDIINNLTSTRTDAALSAYMGKSLNDNKLNKTDVVNNLTTTRTDAALSANMGKKLNEEKVSNITTEKTNQTKIGLFNDSPIGVTAYSNIVWASTDAPTSQTSLINQTVVYKSLDTYGTIITKVGSSSFSGLYFCKISGSTIGNWKTILFNDEIKTLNSTSLVGTGNIVTPTGVKGNAESSYRTGNVNITPANVGISASESDGVITLNIS